MAAQGTQLYVSGPAEAFVGTDNYWALGGTYNPANWLFAGFSQRGFTISITPRYEDLEADYAGAMPADAALLGQEARISGTLARYNDQFAQTIGGFGVADVGGTNAGGVGIVGGVVPPGVFDNFVLGSLMNQELYTYPLLIRCPYGAKAVFQLAPGGVNQGMIPGFLFYSVILADPYEFLASIRYKTPAVAWRSIPTFGQYTSGVFDPDSVLAGFTNGAPYTASIVYSVFPVGFTNWPAAS